MGRSATTHSRAQRSSERLCQRRQAEKDVFLLKEKRAHEFPGWLESRRVLSGPPPAARACPPEGCPPLVLSGKLPSCVKLCSRTKAGASPLPQKPRSSSCRSEITGE